MLSREQHASRTPFGISSVADAPRLAPRLALRPTRNPHGRDFLIEQPDRNAAERASPHPHSTHTLRRGLKGEQNTRPECEWRGAAATRMATKALLQESTAW